ncbi:hypothetical protein [Amycolatopsis sp. lyj-112]|uniref:hypothetical protein n=1 Tax=Amycolatopsis sp. lyj-112 TaxID=2789288 RepID=UPI00397B8E5C
MDEFNEYLDLVAEVRRRHPEQREGQAYFNAARMMWPGLLDDIPAERDPFTVDRRLPAFLEWLPQAHAAHENRSSVADAIEKKTRVREV